jgi:type IV pilus assembly protein PilN
MYSLDINFLKDRGMAQQPTGPRRTPTKPATLTPLFIGVAVGLLLPGFVGGLWFFLQQQIADKQQRQTELAGELARLDIEQKKITQIKEQTAKVNEETTSLAEVFNQIKPWSAMLQDIRERIPPGVQIGRIQEVTAPITNAPTPAPSPVTKAKQANNPQAKQANNPQAKQANNPQAKQANNPQTQQPKKPTTVKAVEISGQARSFDDVNYFLLTLKRSAFLKTDETQLVRAELVKNSSKLEVPQVNRSGQSQGTVTYELPKTVQYTILTRLSDVPASDLLRELDRKGAVGLVTRIRTLQEKGVIKP